jgi:hypothetical protein
MEQIWTNCGQAVLESIWPSPGKGGGSYPVGIKGRIGVSRVIAHGAYVEWNFCQYIW